MIWLTWRQQRFETYIAAAALAIIAALLLVTGLAMASTYSSLGVSRCLVVHPAAGCSTVIDSFENQFSGLSGLAGWLNFVPLIFGLLLGAPLALEMETGTYRLAWTQSITRTRWIAWKLSAIYGLTVVAAAIFAALMTWWRSPLDQLGGHFQPNQAFDFEGLVPYGYTIFAVTVGITVGMVLRRTIPAFAISIGVFFGTRLAVMTWLRPHYLAPLTIVQSPTASGGPGRQDWLLSNGWSDRAGHAISDTTLMNACPP